MPSPSKAKPKHKPKSHAKSEDKSKAKLKAKSKAKPTAKASPASVHHLKDKKKNADEMRDLHGPAKWYERFTGGGSHYWGHKKAS